MVSHPRRLTVHRALHFLIIIYFLFATPVFGALAAPLPQSATGTPGAGNSQAASGIQAVLLPPSTDKFPLITTYMDIRDENDAFVRGLQPSQVTILEDDRPLPLVSIDEIKPGAQFVLALNPGRSFSIRDSNGKTRFDSLLQTIIGWGNAQPNPATDDLSLLISNGAEVIHNSDPRQMVAALQDFKLEGVQETPDLNILSSAVDTVADSTPRQGMGRAILFITSLPSIDLTVGLKSLAGSASQQGIHISIWLVASPDQADSTAAIQLQDLAKQTHGHYFFYSGSETLPDIETILEPVQDSYSLTYTSKITSGVPHKLSAQIDIAGQKIATPLQTFEMNIQAPTPMFVSPPARILRDTPGDSRNPAVDLVPVRQPLDILIEFPDGISRPILTSTLFVDGAVIAVNRSAPFDKFTWDLNSYTTDSDHLLRVEVVDALGLKGASREIPVHIAVKRTTQGVMMALYRNGPLLAGLTTLLAGAVLLLVLILGGRIKPVTFGRGTQPGAKVHPAEKTVPIRRSDPVTQPVLDARGNPIVRHMPAWMNRLQWPQRRISPKAFAYLSRLKEADQEQDSTPIPLDTEEVTLGKDGVRSSLVIEDASVEPLHASLRREGDTYRLSDQGSVAGTWVNYTPVSSEGILLEHGDLIHIGRAGFRFTLRQPGKVRKPVVRPEAPKL